MKVMKALLTSAMLFWAGAGYAADHLPISKAVTQTVGRGHYVSVKAQVTAQGRAVGTIRARNKVALRGFHGQALLTIKDRRGNILWSRFTPRVGVNAYWFSGDDRTVRFSFKLPKEVRDQAHTLEIKAVRGFRNPLHILKENIKDLKKIGL